MHASRPFGRDGEKCNEKIGLSGRQSASTGGNRINKCSIAASNASLKAKYSRALDEVQMTLSRLRMASSSDGFHSVGEEKSSEISKERSLAESVDEAILSTLYESRHSVSWEHAASFESFSDEENVCNIPRPTVEQKGDFVASARSSFLQSSDQIASELTSTRASEIDGLEQYRGLSGSRRGSAWWRSARPLEEETPFSSPASSTLVPESDNTAQDSKGQQASAPSKREGAEVREVILVGGASAAALGPDDELLAILASRVPDPDTDATVRGQVEMRRLEVIRLLSRYGRRAAPNGLTMLLTAPRDNSFSDIIPGQDSVPVPIERPPDMHDEACGWGACSALRLLDFSAVIADPNAPDCPLIAVSRGFCALTGYEPWEVIGRNCRFLQTNETDIPTINLVRNFVQGLISGREREDADLLVKLLNRKKSGELFWNLLHISATRLHGHFLIVGMQADVSSIVAEYRFDLDNRAETHLLRQTVKELTAKSLADLTATSSSSSR